MGQTQWQQLLDTIDMNSYGFAMQLAATLLLVLSYPATASDSSEQQEAVQLLLDVTTSRNIGGVSELNRLKYFNLCDDGLHFYNHVPSKEAGDALLDDLNITEAFQ